MAERIKINTGSKLYEIEDEAGNVLGTFRFIPSDVTIAKRYKEVAKYFEDFSQTITEENAEKMLPEFDKGIREKIDYLFNAPASESFFTVTGPLTLLENGQSYVEHIISAVGAIIEKETKERSDKMEAAISKYTEKYK